jgi:hypothetical protein
MNIQLCEYVKTKHGYAFVIEYSFIQSSSRELSNFHNFKVRLCDLPHYIDKDSVKELVESRFVTIEYQRCVVYYYGSRYMYM